MRVLVVTQYFWPENFRINDLVLELAKRGHEITILTGKPNYPSGKLFEEYRKKPEDFDDYHGLKIYRVPMMVRGNSSIRLLMNYLTFVLGASLWGVWFLRNRSYDVIFVFEPSPVTVGLPAIFIGRLKTIPVVFWALDLWPETLSAIGVLRSPRLLGMVGRLVKYIYDRCTLVLGQSQGFLASIAKYCSKPKKIRYFPSWAEDIFKQSAGIKAPEVPQCENRFTILFAGNVGEAQDLPSIVEAADQLKNNPTIRWLIVGDGRMSDWLQSEVDARGLQDNMLLLGRFPVERMPSFYAHADALLVSLKNEPVFRMTIPGKIQSYLMSGIPLIGMLDGEGAKVIRQADAGLTCAAGDSSGLATAVLTMASMSIEQRNELGLNGRRYAEKEFGREMLMDRLEKYFEEAVTSHKNNLAVK